jgi:hypothetical protein
MAGRPPPVGDDGYLSSTPAVLTGLDATYDHALSDTWGIRLRAGAVLLAVDEITGVAPHGEAGPVARLPIAPRLALDAALLGGIHIGGLEHKREWQDRTGPTIAAEAALRLLVTDRLLASVAGGYRVAWTATERIDPLPGDSPDPLATGPVLRLDLGWTF